ncbi:hypothetical protein D3C81_1430660 [compost metagenome]
MLEHAIARAVAGHLEHVTNLQLQLGLVPLIRVGTIGIAHERRGVGTGTGKQVLAVLITAVHEAQQLIFQLTQLGCLGLALGVGIAGVTRLDRQLVDPRQDRVDRIERGLGLVQRVGDVCRVGLVLGQHVCLIAQLQQTRSPHRIIGSGVDPDEGTGLFVGLDQVGIVALVVRRAGLVELGRGNTHGSILLKAQRSGC